MNTIKQTYVIAATPEQVWRALTDPVMIREWSEASVEFPLQVGATYSLWNGSIGGEIVEIVPGQCLVQTWKPLDWARTDSVVRFTIMPEEGTTLVDLVHENVEESDYEDTNDGWDRYYLGAIKRMLETKTAKPAKVAKPAKKASTAKTAKAAKPAKKAGTAKKTVAPKKGKPAKTKRTSSRR